MNDAERKPLRLRFLGSLVEQLGAQLYPGATATIAELISNAWDADARTVWIDLPLGTAWTESDLITVTDDGIGMSYEDAENRYLLVGRKRRADLNRDTSDGGRPLHGRKGIGKLAAFGTARILECLTVDRSGEATSFRLDYDAIRSLEPSADYRVEPAQGDTTLRDPDGNELAHGTRITLSALRPRRALNEHQFRRSLARRFALDADQMRIVLNGEDIGRFDLDLDVRFPVDAQLLDGVRVLPDGWGRCELDGQPVRWWIGFTAKPLQEKELQGISVLARGKLVQRPFFFQRTAGAEGQLGQEYLVGEVQADWLDVGLDIESDLIQANRDQLQLEDERLNSFVTWGQKLLREALRAWSSIRQQRVSDHLNVCEFDDLLERLTPEERNRLTRVARAVAGIPAIDLDEARSLVRSVVDAHEDTIVRGLLEDIDASEPDFQTRIWDVVQQFGLIDARRNQTVIEARLKAIAELRQFVDSGALEVPTIHEHIKRHPWLLDPRWYLLDDEVRLSDLGITPDEGDSDGRMDYLFALGPSAPYTHDELLVVEIKRGTYPDGRPRSVSPEEVSRFHDYVLAAHESQNLSSEPLRVTGLMIAQRYTDRADLRRKSLQTVHDVRLVFSTWNRVLKETERLHEGWLAVTSRRAVDHSDS
ncbi:ATP-binding protein [Candidatus Poriferisodalis sp.]|uniref:ATP-binding protein n=1 Tax=Candidatus Poriferisodalis sp. TaxID=3101277 RepID=UPI003B5CD37B